MHSGRSELLSKHLTWRETPKVNVNCPLRASTVRAQGQQCNPLQYPSHRFHNHVSGQWYCCHRLISSEPSKNIPCELLRFVATPCRSTELIIIGHFIHIPIIVEPPNPEMEPVTRPSRIPKIKSSCPHTSSPSYRPCACAEKPDETDAEGEQKNR